MDADISTSASVNSFIFDRIRIQSGGSNPGFDFDELYIGNSWDDLFPTAVPEPGTGILLLMSATIGLFFRRPLSGLQGKL